MCIVFGYSSGHWCPTARGSCVRDSGAVIGLARLWWLTEFFTHMTTISLFKFVARFYTVGHLPMNGHFSKQNRTRFKDVQKQRIHWHSYSASGHAPFREAIPVVVEPKDTPPCPLQTTPFSKQAQSSWQRTGSIKQFVYGAFVAYIHYWPSFYLTWLTVKCNMWMQNYIIPRDVKGFRCRSWY